MINVCYGLYDATGKYSKFVGTSMTSIFENTSLPVTVHILHDETLTDKNRDKFNFLAGRYNQTVKFYNVEKICPDKIQFLKDKIASVNKSRFSLGTFYRLLLKEILYSEGRVQKAIYLDADIILNMDIAELWQQNLGENVLAAVPELQAVQGYMIKNKFLINEGKVKLENYFNAGVILFDLDKLGENFFEEGVQFLSDNPRCECFDQDILNNFFSEKYLHLSEKFDSFVVVDNLFLHTNKLADKIYHYAGNVFGMDSKNVFDQLFLKHFSKTPWFNFEIFGGLNEAFIEEKTKDILQIQWVMRTLSQKQRGFFVTAGNLPVLTQIFNITDKDVFVELKDTTSVDALTEKMKALRGQIIFFLFVDEYSPWRNELITRGFAENLDFVNGVDFMTEAQSHQKKKSYQFVGKM